MIVNGTVVGSRRSGEGILHNICYSDSVTAALMGLKCGHADRSPAVPLSHLTLRCLLKIVSSVARVTQMSFASESC